MPSKRDKAKRWFWLFLAATWVLFFAVAYILLREQRHHRQEVLDELRLQFDALKAHVDSSKTIRDEHQQLKGELRRAGITMEHIRARANINDRRRGERLENQAAANENP